MNWAWSQRLTVISCKNDSPEFGCSAIAFAACRNHSLGRAAVQGSVDVTEGADPGAAGLFLTHSDTNKPREGLAENY